MVEGDQTKNPWERSVGSPLHSIVLSCALAAAVLVCSNAWAESAKEAKEKILQDVRDKERAVQREEEKLKSLYKEQQTLDPDARLNELSNKAAKISMEAAKMAADQIKTGPINTPKKAADSIGRGKDVVDKYRELWKAEGDAIDAVTREQDLRMFDIPAQERKLEKAKVDLGVAKGAAEVAKSGQRMSRQGRKPTSITPGDPFPQPCSRPVVA